MGNFFDSFLTLLGFRARRARNGSVAGFSQANRQSLAFSERGQLSQAIPQFHVERMLNEWTPIAWFESQHNECRVCED